MVSEPIEFFQQMRAGFGQILAAPGADAQAMSTALAGRAFGWFESNVDEQTRGLPPLACTKGCPTCCALRVTATAPEIFAMADYVRKVDATPQGARLALASRIRETNAQTSGQSETRRLASGTPCPILVEGVCVLHPVRTLACRGLAAYAQAECKAAARGEDTTVALSEPHLRLRALVQHALQAALRDKGLAWGLYELNQGLALALAEPQRMDAWLAGEDSLAPASAERPADPRRMALVQVLDAMPAPA
ncbi:hypothetical protein MTR62_19395 [Novosphingobium sp. 1949]|uniref:YkgJ family cysteine cluster protein n=1 Tax=Novosphingobium organovorum TaxID=2930092 RepID=A0ABT0BIF8_9SPHN|nr:hypothetical protein [Novosphingobium organovorum]MCJ2184837.1 hypothetical protein [Novosphingobium organovorum]